MGSQPDQFLDRCTEPEPPGNEPGGGPGFHVLDVDPQSRVWAYCDESDTARSGQPLATGAVHDVGAGDRRDVADRLGHVDDDGDAGSVRQFDDLDDRLHHPVTRPDVADVDEIGLLELQHVLQGIGVHAPVHVGRGHRGTPNPRRPNSTRLGPNSLRATHTVVVTGRFATPRSARSAARAVSR